MKHLVTLAIAFVVAAFAEVRPRNSSGCDLRKPHAPPARTSCPVWGWGDTGAEVTVRFAGQTKAATVDAAGRWRVMLDPMPASAEPREVQIGRSVIRDVLVGDVWLCGGDAFMAKTVGSTRSARSELASREFPPVRLFRVQTVAAKEPQPEVPGSWTIPDRKSVGDFPALAYLFAKEVHAKMHVPVGIVEVTDASPVRICTACLRGSPTTSSSARDSGRC